MVRRTDVGGRLFNIERQNTKKVKKAVGICRKNIPLQCFSDDNESIITSQPTSTLTIAYILIM